MMLLVTYKSLIRKQNENNNDIIQVPIMNLQASADNTTSSMDHNETILESFRQHINFNAGKDTAISIEKTGSTHINGKWYILCNKDDRDKLRKQVDNVMQFSKLVTATSDEKATTT